MCFAGCVIIRIINMKLTLEEVKKSSQIKNFIRQTEKYLDSIGYTDHGFRHINIVSDRARGLAKKIGLSSKDQELSAIAGYCHDMGNFLGRTYHHYLGAMLFSQIFINNTDSPNGVSTIMQAIATHDKDELKIVNKISAVLILADKSDVHKSRVKNKSLKDIKEDIHDRVNYSVNNNVFKFNNKKKEIVLRLKIDTKITSVMEYFEIFNERMVFCRKSAKYLNCKFVLIINNFRLS